MAPPSRSETTPGAAVPETIAGDAVPHERESPGTGRRGTYAISLLTAIFALNFLDRQIVTILAGPIKAEMGLSDTQIGLISGLAFALFYALLGLPIAMLAERFNRVWIIAGSAGLWSVMTALCGATMNFGQLFLARLGVGIGEAGCIPASHALIADTVDPARRASALSLFSLGIPIGTLLGMVMGGWIAAEYGWRAAFLVAGLPGIALAALLAMTVRDPRHGSAWSGSSREATAYPPLVLRSAIRSLLAIPSYRQALAAGTLASMGSFGITAFLGIYVQARHGLTLPQTGLLLGLVIGIAGGVGSAAGGMLVDRIGTRAAHAQVPGLAVLVTAPCLAGALLVDNAVIAFILFVLGTAASTLWYGPTFGLFQGVSGPHRRAVAIAFFTLSANLIGLGLGPTLIGIASDGMTSQCTPACPAPFDLPLEIALTCATLLYLWSGLHYRAAARAVERDWQG